MKKKREPIRFESVIGRRLVQGWWTQAELIFGDAVGWIPAVLDTGSPHTILPKQFADRLVDTSNLAFDMPIDTAFGRAVVAPVLSEISISVHQSKVRRAKITTMVPESELQGFDFVIIGLNALDQLGARMSFGQHRKLSGQSSDKPEISIELISPISYGGADVL